MARKNPLVWLVLSLICVVACGPDTVFLRPALDTPAQHVKNGYSLMECGKIDAAHNEFAHARSLDNGYVPAYVGIALIQGRHGDIDGGLATLKQARDLATTPEEISAVNQGYEQLQRMQPALQE